MPTSLALLPQLVVLDVSMNALSGTLKDFAFATVANRADLYSTLRYFDISNNTFGGELSFCSLIATLMHILQFPESH